MLLYTNRACTGATTTVRSATRLMQVEMHHIEAHIARASDTQHSISIGTIVVQLSPSLMNHRSNLSNVAIEKAKRIGIGHHDGRNIGSIGIQQGFEMLHVDTAGFLVALDLNRFVVGKRR